VKDAELLSQILTIVGIPQDMVVNICQDSDKGNRHQKPMQVPIVQSCLENRPKWFERFKSSMMIKIMFYEKSKNSPSMGS
jgi:hypothetical protein